MNSPDEILLPIEVASSRASNLSNPCTNEHTDDLPPNSKCDGENISGCNHSNDVSRLSKLLEREVAKSAACDIQAFTNAKGPACSGEACGHVDDHEVNK
jgi:hypothetical protein